MAYRVEATVMNDVVRLVTLLEQERQSLLQIVMNYQYMAEQLAAGQTEDDMADLIDRLATLLSENNHTAEIDALLLRVATTAIPQCEENTEEDCGNTCDCDRADCSCDTVDDEAEPATVDTSGCGDPQCAICGHTDTVYTVDTVDDEDDDLRVAMAIEDDGEDDDFRIPSDMVADALGAEDDGAVVTITVDNLHDRVDFNVIYDTLSAMTPEAAEATTVILNDMLDELFGETRGSLATEADESMRKAMADDQEAVVDYLLNALRNEFTAMLNRQS